MKRTLFVFLIFISIHAYSQEHLKFMGIPIDGNVVHFLEKLEAKGFALKKTEKNCAILYGLYTDERATIYVFHSAITYKVYLVDVYFDKKDTWYELEKQYREYQDLLRKKYGNPTDYIEEFYEPYYDNHKGLELNALSKGKCVFDTYYESNKGLITLEISKSQQLNLSYQDAANAKIMRKEREHNKIDDL